MRTRREAVESIDRDLREERTGYTFETLRDRFLDAYYEGHRVCCVGVPSQAEMNFPHPVVALALFGEDSAVGRMAIRKMEDK